jgi:GAF domain-containing protein
MSEGDDAAKRAESLRRYGIMDSPAEEVFDQIVRDAAFLTGAPVSTISMVDEYRQWFKAKIGLSHDGDPIDQSICAVAVQQSGTFIVDDASKDDRFRNLNAVGEGAIRFYAGIPLVVRDGTQIGTLCVIDNQARQGLDDEERNALEALAKRTVAALEVRRDLRDAGEGDHPSNHIWMDRAKVLLEQAAAALTHVGATGALAQLEQVIDVVASIDQKQERG